MDLYTLGSNTVNSALGNIQRGIIEIIDLRSVDIPKTEEPVGAGGVASISSLNFGDSIANQAATQFNKVSGSAAKLVGNTSVGEVGSTFLSENMASVVGRMAGALGSDAISRKRFTVQFNPSEIRLSGYGGGMYRKLEYSQDEEQNKIVFEAMRPRITLDLNLIFDDVDPQEAFMTEPFSMSASSAVKTGAKFIQSKVGKKNKVTVQDKVEAFTAALRDERTRFITFYWGELCYSGTLIRVSARYTMFDIAGMPVRAVVGLSIVCLDDTADESDTAEWERFYEDAFRTSGSLSGKATSVGSKVGNLLNINL